LVLEVSKVFIQAPDFLISNFNPLGIKLKSKGYKLNYNNGIEGVLVFIFGSIVIKRLFRARLLKSRF
jgi:hypothetical protein